MCNDCHSFIELRGCKQIRYRLLKNIPQRWDAFFFYNAVYQYTYGFGFKTSSAHPNRCRMIPILALLDNYQADRFEVVYAANCRCTLQDAY